MRGPPKVYEGDLQGLRGGLGRGENASVSSLAFNAFTSSCAPRIGLQANAVQRARRMRLESPASPRALPPES